MPNDELLLRRCRNGDDDAALQIYLKYAEKLICLAKKETSAELAARFDPEDIVQSVFRTFFRRVANGQYEAPDGDELWKLLLVMALNKVRTRATQHRAGKRDIRKTEGSDSLDDSFRNRCEKETAETILRLSIDELIEQQPESHRAIIRHRINGLDVQAISDECGKSKRTVERVLQSFRQELIRSALVPNIEGSM